ncbi:MAG: alpha-hydroxy-acid oxidizing protein, partial [Gemmatimonadaceae bacterium]
MAEILSLPELAEQARSSMSPMAYEYVASGAADELTVSWNREAFDRIPLRPRVLQDTPAVDTGLSLFGKSMPHPILLAPTAYHKAIHPEGEIATARGAG